MISCFFTTSSRYILCYFLNKRPLVTEISYCAFKNVLHMQTHSTYTEKHKSRPRWCIFLLLCSAFPHINSKAYPVLLPIQWGVQSGATKSDGEEQWGWWLSSDWMFQLLIVMPWCSESCSADSTIYFNQDRGEMGVDVSPSFQSSFTFRCRGVCSLSFSLFLYFTHTHTHTHMLRWIESGEEVAVGNA